MSEIIHAMTKHGMLSPEHAKLLAEHLTTPEGTPNPVHTFTNMRDKISLDNKTNWRENPKLRAAIDTANKLGLIKTHQSGGGTYGPIHEVHLNSHWTNEFREYLKSFESAAKKK